MQIGLGLIGWLLGCLIWAAPLQASLIIGPENYEVADIPALLAKNPGNGVYQQWTNFYNVGAGANGVGNIDISTTHAHSGTRSLRFSYPLGHTQSPPPLGTNGFDDSNIGVFFNPVQELWETYWVYYEAIDGTKPSGWVDGVTAFASKQHYFNTAGADSSSPLTNFGFFNSAPEGDLTTHLYIDGETVTATPCVAGAPAGSSVNCIYWQNAASVQMPYNQWVCIETHLRMEDVGQQNGIVEIYQNGVKTVGWTNATLRDSSSNGVFRHVIFYRQDAVNQYRYEDDYAMATTRIGCAGGSPAPPGQVIGVTATPDVGSSTSITVGWSAVIDPTGIGLYNVQRAPGPACAPMATVVQVNALTWQDTGRTPSTQYCYQINAQDVLGQPGPFSSPPVTATTNASAAILPTSTNMTTTPTQTTIVGTQDTSNPAAFMRIVTDGAGGSSVVPIASVVGWPASGTCASCTGVLTYNFSGGTFACAHPQDASHNEDPVNFRCNGIQAGGPPTAPTNLQVH